MHANPHTPSLTRITRNLLTGLTALAVFSAMRAPADTILSQNFDSDPVNYTLPADSAAQVSTNRYWSLSNAPGITLNPNLTGNASTYWTAQNLDSLPTAVNPGQIDFEVPAVGFSDLKLSIDLAGAGSAETANYVRAKLDDDGDGNYETTLFNFAGTNNSPYTSALGQLNLAFATFSDIALPSPTSPNGRLRLRLEIFNDTDSLNENVGIDNILITGIPTGGNIPPAVSITSPANNATVGADFTIQATATDADGIASVKFYDGTTLLGTATNFPYGHIVVGAAYGPHLLRAVAEDTLGATTQSSTVTVYHLDPATPFGINVNMDSTVQPGLVGPAGGLGAVWNTIGASAGSNLRQTSGPATSVGFTSSGTGGWGGPNFNDTEPALRMLKTQWVNFGANGTTQQLLITGLDPAKTYDLYIASAILITTNQASRGEWFTTNTTSPVGNQPVDNTLDENGSTWVRGNNYVLFEDVVPDASGNITANGFAITGAPYDIRLPLNGFQLVESTPLIAGPVDNARSTVTATPAAVVANGVSASTVNVTLRDANGVRVPNKQVTLGNNGGLTPPAALTTNAQGVAGFAVRSSTVGTVVFTATVVADGLTLTDTASVEFTDPEAPVAFNLNIYADTPATGLVGVVGAPGETWNQGTTSASNLIDSTGTVASSVSVTGLPGDGYNVNAALKVFAANRNFFSKAQDTTISITGLVPDTAYDLYIYSLSHNDGSWGDFTNTERAAGDFVTSNTVLRSASSQFLDNGISGVNGSTFVANGNYVVFQSIVSNPQGNISVLADAHDGIDGNPSTSDGDCRLHISGLQIRPATGMSLDYVAWRDSQYPGLGLPDADDDGDGSSNDYERIFGMDPTDPASSSPYWAGIDPATGSLGYTRRLQSLININYKVWYSTDLANWLEDNATLQTVESVSNNVEFMGVAIDPVLLSGPRLFVRVLATPITGLDPEPSLVNLWGSGNSITVLFSEPMNPSSAANPLNYQVVQNGGGTIAITGVTLSSDGGSATLTLASALGNNTGYTVNLDGVTSGTGQSLGTGVVSRQFKTWDNDPNGIKVFILAGQSNMVGYGNVETGNSGAGTVGSLRYLAVNDASLPDYNYASLLTNPAQPATSAFRTRSDVKVWWRDGGANLGGTVRKGDLGPPFKGADNARIGPEFAFGHVIGDFYPSNNVLIVKSAWGGRSLVQDFRPPSAVAARGGRVGDFFSAIIDDTRDVLTNLDTEFPEWSGQGYQIVGFGWHQGFNDLIDATASAEYKDNLPDLIKNVREVFGKPNLPFAIASTGMDAGPVEPPPYAGYRTIEKAQLWVAGVPKPANVLSTDARPFWRVAAVSPANEGYHWNWNAESYFLIGKSLGDNMVNLLAR